MIQQQVQHKTYFDPHGYFFACLPDSVYRRRLQSFGEPLTDELIPARGPSSDPDLLSGVLTCRLVCITPVHIGSGSYRHEPNAPGNAVADVVRDPRGSFVIPGSSLKGSFRAIAEAASKSCLSLKQDLYDEEFQKLPWETGYRRRTRPSNTYWASHIQQPLVDRNNQLRQQKHRNPKVPVRILTDTSFSRCTIDAVPERSKLCPCCSVFGTLGYRGRVAFNDARVINRLAPLAEFDPPMWVTIPARNSPQPHRLADKATWVGDPTDRSKVGGLNIQESGRNLKLVVLNPLGRKFYPNWDPHGHFQTDCYDWSQLRRGFPKGRPLNGTFYQQMQQQYGRVKWPSSLYNTDAFQQGEPHDVIPIGMVLEFRLHFQSLLPWELGLLLFSMGIGAAWLPKVGGAKAYGLGTVWVEPQALQMISDIAAYADPAPLSTQQMVQQIKRCLAAFRRHQQSYHADGIADLGAGFSLNLAAQQQSGRLHVADNVVPMPR